jgi:hypothetical protein
MLYCVNIFKINQESTPTQWGGLNTCMSLMLQGDLERELVSYGFPEQAQIIILSLEKGGYECQSVKWNGWTVYVQVRRIN